MLTPAANPAGCNLWHIAARQETARRAWKCQENATYDSAMNFSDCFAARL
jgi:hypothetical protein